MVTHYGRNGRPSWDGKLDRLRRQQGGDQKVLVYQQRCVPRALTPSSQSLLAESLEESLTCAGTHAQLSRGWASSIGQSGGAEPALE